MAATIQPAKTKYMNRKPELLFKLEGFDSDINQALVVSGEDAIITACEDRSLRVWLKRDNGRFWPAAIQWLPSSVASIEYSGETRHLFAGQDNGTIVELLLSEDANHLGHVRDYLAHTGRVNAVLFALQTEWLLSTSKDRFVTWHCSESGLRLGGYQLEGAGTCLQYDSASKYVFVGDSCGSIHILSLAKFARGSSAASNVTTATGGCDVIHVLHGHSENITALSWESVSTRLFSASSDNIVIAWNIGGGKGSAFELQGHTKSVTSVAWCDGKRSTGQVVSAGLDGQVVFWSMSVKRMETPSWRESDICQTCSTPFFWNIRKMWEDKSVGKRQHHCRRCGHAVCEECSPHRSTYPIMGFEREVRMCTNCYNQIQDSDRVPMAVICDVRHPVVCMHVDPTRNFMLTTGKDKVVKLWDISALLS